MKSFVVCLLLLILFVVVVLFCFGYRLVSTTRTSTTRKQSIRRRARPDILKRFLLFHIHLYPTLFELLFVFDLLAMAEPEEPEPWKTSKAKKILSSLILDGTVTAESDTDVVYNSQEEFQQYNIRSFKTNLRNLIAGLKLKEERAFFDNAAIEHHLLHFPRPQLTNRNYPFWDTSSAMTLLAEDINEGLHQQMTPSQLRNTQPEYQEFPLDVFRRHIHQEKRRRIQSNFALFKKEQKRKA
jgi:hypothetical protein